jgi:hypothetical protein
MPAASGDEVLRYAQDDVTYLPLNTGLRFSRKAEVPSL